MAVKIPETLSDHPSLIGVVRMPRCSTINKTTPIPIVKKDGDKWYNIITDVQMSSSIISNNLASDFVTINKSQVTDFFPYTYYVLTDGEAESLILEPQHLPTTLQIKGKYACSNQPIERYYIPNYRGDLNGTVYNITNINQMMLPTASNEGLQYLSANANTIMQTRKNQVTGNVLNGANVIGSAIVTGGMSLVGGGVSSVISGLTSIKETDARQKDVLLTPNTISSFGTPSTRYAFDTDNVRLLKYSIKDNVKNKILSYTNRYGNKYNNYATIDIKNYKGYIKYINPDLDTKIDNIYISKLLTILERGVFCE